jgi:hypothetical protein
VNDEFTALGKDDDGVRAARCSVRTYLKPALSSPGPDNGSEEALTLQREIEE